MNINSKLDSLRSIGSSVGGAFGHTGRRVTQTLDEGRKAESLKALGVAASAAAVAYWSLNRLRAGHPQRDNHGW